ncbi:MmgE/PrpD family protein [Amycolatopsis endophytica]|uniref:2-methylcitrate dehydratase PrpD n=1 Tax=Amycolatopsis endophytica TaxID=860233 RepID=A0A853B8I1_9PSEU|nr:MmgE/PrpD family protein [Amycolatopsis endophytica]NYI91320.1 2-methylcitrate dehydratase PrpD [Amycolatopsis endophytica]
MTTHPAATKALARFAAESGVDSSVTSGLPALFLDHIGIAAFAAAEAESSPAVRAAVDRLDPHGGDATVIGVARRYSPPYAAFLNGVHAHSLDMDDTNRAQTGHPGVAIFPAATADAERLDVDGRTFLDAVAVGYEVCCRIGASLTARSYERGFHITAVSGVFGAVAAVARLRGFDANTTASAFGLALSRAAGSMQYLANGAWNKRLHPGFLAHDALTCAALAETGAVGAAEALEGRYGLLNGYTEEARPDALTDGLGTDWLLLGTAVKPYPSCRLTHGAVDAALALRGTVPEPGRTALLVGIPAAAMPIIGEPGAAKRRPQSVVDAQFSVHFQVACAWLDGRVDWASYQRLTDPDVIAMMDRITVTADESVPNGGGVLTVGPGVSRAVPVPLGEPENRIGDDALRAKFASLAGRVFDDGQVAGIADGVLGLTPESSVRALVRTLAAA